MILVWKVLQAEVSLSTSLMQQQTDRQQPLALWLTTAAEAAKVLPSSDKVVTRGVETWLEAEE